MVYNISSCVNGKTFSGDEVDLTHSELFGKAK